MRFAYCDSHALEIFSHGCCKIMNPAGDSDFHNNFKLVKVEVCPPRQWFISWNCCTAPQRGAVDTLNLSYVGMFTTFLFTEKAWRTLWCGEKGVAVWLSSGVLLHGTAIGENNDRNPRKWKALTYRYMEKSFDSITIANCGFNFQTLSRSGEPHHSNDSRLSFDLAVRTVLSSASIFNCRVADKLAPQKFIDLLGKFTVHFTDHSLLLWVLWVLCHIQLNWFALGNHSGRIYWSEMNLVIIWISIGIWA